ncbi:MAG: KTSC domain-containing protein [Betaproteobacteria bacterium]|nr:KTSC domain-containing protein [Betaproteobacteria bacterium]
MEMKVINAGNLRAIGYDEKRRVLVVQQASGTYEYSNVSAEIWRRFSTSASQQSFFRDNIDEEFMKRRIR